MTRTMPHINETFEEFVRACKYKTHPAYLSPERKPPAGPYSLALHEIPLDEGGYTYSGRYFGVGVTLWAVELENDDGDVYVYSHVRTEDPDSLGSVLISAGYNVCHVSVSRDDE